MWYVVPTLQKITRTLCFNTRMLRTINTGTVKDRKKFLPDVLKTIPLEENTPLYHTGHPLQAPSENVLWLLNHCPDEAHVFSTHARAPLLLVFEGKRVQVEEVEDQSTETKEKTREHRVDSVTQDNLRRACRSYVLTPFGVAVRTDSPS